jgi:hypothetical protein
MHYFFKIIIIKKKIRPSVARPGKPGLAYNPIKQQPACGPARLDPITRAYILFKFNGWTTRASRKKKGRITCISRRRVICSSQNNGKKKKNRVFCFLLKNSFSTYFWLKAPRKHPRDHIKSIYGYGKKIKNHPKIEPFDIKKIILVAGFLTNGYFPSPS